MSYKNYSGTAIYLYNGMGLNFNTSHTVFSRRPNTVQRGFFEKINWR